MKHWRESLRAQQNADLAAYLIIALLATGLLLAVVPLPNVRL